MVSWKEYKLQKENRKLKGHIKACLELIDDLSNLEAPLLDPSTSISFKKKYLKIVSRAKKSIE